MKGTSKGNENEEEAEDKEEGHEEGKRNEERRGEVARAGRQAPAPDTDCPETVLQRRW